MLGRVTFFDPQKHFGRIKSFEDGSEVFVHSNQITVEAPSFRSNLVKGDEVTYNTGLDGQSRETATNVRIVESSIKSEDPDAYVEVGIIFPVGQKVPSDRLDVTQIVRPDQSLLFCRLFDIVTEGEILRPRQCRYRIESWGRSEQKMLAAKQVELFEEPLTAEEDFAQQMLEEVEAESTRVESTSAPSLTATIGDAVKFVPVQVVEKPAPAAKPSPAKPVKQIIVAPEPAKVEPQGEYFCRLCDTWFLDVPDSAKLISWRKGGWNVFLDLATGRIHSIRRKTKRAKQTPKEETCFN